MKEISEGSVSTKVALLDAEDQIDKDITVNIKVIGIFTKEEALNIYQRGPEVVAFYLLEMSKALDEARAKIEEKDELLNNLLATKKEKGLSTPSGAKPVYEKENTPRRGRKKPGRSKGHKGEHRVLPVEVTHEEHITLGHCPDCGNEVQESEITRERLVEDIKKTEPEVTRYVIHRYYCKTCDKIVEPKVTTALLKVKHRYILDLTDSVASLRIGHYYRKNFGCS